MTPLAFFRAEEVRRVVERASRAAAMPVSVHYVAHGEEGPCIMASGGCEACRYVSARDGGVRACRESRLRAALDALHRRAPSPFLCHMGFACVSTHALNGRDHGFVLTFGPYCPAETGPQADALATIEDDFRAGLATLSGGAAPGPLPSLTNIRLVPSDAAVAVAEWAVDTLTSLWESLSEAEEVEEEGQPSEENSRFSRSHGKSTSSGFDPYGTRTIAAALASGDESGARSLARSAISETRVGRRVRIDVLRARAIAVVSAALEAAEGARLQTADAWERFPRFVEEVRKTGSASGLCDAMMAVLGRVSAAARREQVDGSGLGALNRLVRARLPGRVSLAQVARETGQNPTAITHQLQRRFGMSFSQYVGRLRINKAKELLRRTRLGVSEVARRVGIRDSGNFSKLFRKYEGISPTQYRTRFRSRR